MGQNVTLTATVAGGSTAPTGTVTFENGSSTIGTAPVSLVNGVATVTFTPRVHHRWLGDAVGRLHAAPGTSFVTSTGTLSLA